MKEYRNPKVRPITANETLVEYMSTKEYKDSFKNVGISTLDQMDEDRIEFSRNLTHSQRMEYLVLLQHIAFGEIIKKLPEKYSGEIYFD